MLSRQQMRSFVMLACLQVPAKAQAGHGQCPSRPGARQRGLRQSMVGLLQSCKDI